MDMLQLKLPSVADAEGLARLGEFSFDVERSSSDTLNSTGITMSFSGVPVTIRCEGDSQFKDSSGNDLGYEVTSVVGQTLTVYFGVGKTRVFIPKKRLFIFQCLGSPTKRNLVFSNFLGIDALWTFESRRFSFGNNNKLKYFNLSNVAIFRASGSDIDDWVENGNFTPSKVRNISGLSATIDTIKTFTGVNDVLLQNCTGNVEDLGPCTAMTQFSVNVSGNTECVGTVEGMAAAMVAAGRTSGTVVCNFTKTNVTYNGSKIYNTLSIAFSQSYPNGYQVTIT